LANRAVIRFIEHFLRMIVRPRVLSGDYVWGLGSFSSSAGNFNEVGDRAAGKK
jgi:hypothetical protein